MTIVIVAAASDLERLPADIRKPGSLFSFVLPLPKPDLVGRQAILEKLLYETGTPLSRDIDLGAIAQRLGIDPTPLEVYRKEGMFLDDLSCCDNDCVC